MPTHPENLTIRPVQAGDVPAIVTMVQRLAAHEGENADPFDEAACMRDYLTTPKAHMQVALMGEKPVGFIQYSEGYDLFSASSGSQMGDIFVEERWRGQGIGRRLMQACASDTLARGGRWMAWSTDGRNRQALAFYAALGAVEMQGVKRLALGENALKQTR